MVSNINILDPFNRIQPGPFISQYQDWIIFTLLLFFFWAVAGIALRKKFEESRHLRVLVTVLALMLAVGTYYSIYQGWLHFSLQGLGLFGAILVLIIIFFIIFGLMRGYGMHLSNALPLGFGLFYMSLWAISPNILHNLQRIFPPINGILAILFIVSVIKVMFSFFRHTKPGGLAMRPQLQTSYGSGSDIAEIERDLTFGKKIGKWMKGKTMKLTRMEIRTITHMEDYIQQVIKIIKTHGNNLSPNKITEISKAILKIRKSETIFKKGLNRINDHLSRYQVVERKDLAVLERRLSATKDKAKTALIKDEIYYHHKIIEAEKFMQQYEQPVLEFTDAFNGLLGISIEKLEAGHPGEALPHLEFIMKKLFQMKPIFEKQAEIEKYILKLNKRKVDDFKKEKVRIKGK